MKRHDALGLTQRVVQKRTPRSSTLNLDSRRDNVTITLHPELGQLADLIKARNAIDDQIAAIIDRPASIGHIGEYIASRVFGIALEDSAVCKGHDGRFADGPLAGKTVNVKFYGQHEFCLDVNPDGIPDYYLVLTGPKATSMTSRGGVRPLVVESVYLFKSGPLLDALRERGVKLGAATSVAKGLWEAAEVYPTPRITALVLTPEQRRALSQFESVQEVDASRTVG